jgi:hypothetical protein
VATKTAPWSLKQKLVALTRGSHQPANQHVEFLCGEFVDMINKGQWILLPTRLLMDARNLHLSPLGVLPQRDHCPRTICDYFLKSGERRHNQIVPRGFHAVWPSFVQNFAADRLLGPEVGTGVLVKD